MATDAVILPDDVPALPDTALLLHIGIHKTGSTALQATMRQQRDALSEHGVTYPRTTVSAAQAARSLLGREMGWEPSTASRRDRAALWREFADQVRPLPGRVVVSAEALCQTSDAEAATVVEDLGRDRLHVVVCFRSLGGLLTSSWQQYLKVGRSIPLDRWLHEVLVDPSEEMDTPSFWLRNDVPVLLARWTDLVGPERVTVIVTDPAEPTNVPTTFERLLALPSGLLSRPPTRVRINRSMSAVEAELLRQVNEVARSKMRSVDYGRIVRDGAARYLVESRAPSEDERPLCLPRWTAPLVAEISDRHVAALHAVRAEGATVVGDPADLLRPPCTEDVATPALVPIDAAVALTLGAALGATRTRSAEGVDAHPSKRQWSMTALAARARLRLGRRRG